MTNVPGLTADATDQLPPAPADPAELIQGLKAATWTRQWWRNENLETSERIAAIYNAPTEGVYGIALYENGTTEVRGYRSRDDRNDDARRYLNTEWLELQARMDSTA